KEYYECQMDRAFKQFEIKRKLQIERIELMEDDTDISYDCRILLIRPSTTLYALKDQKLIHNEDIYNIMRQFHDDNKDLELSSCPIIY
ncbi:TPA: hypothetical protein HA293_05095, partial [Candidatus Woesearchaeota archaeon]|nr:hypothetical protein [Candidatus Woesearchaeota archaeon]